MLIFEICILCVTFILLIILHFYLHNKEKVDVAEVMLEVSLGWFINGDLSDEEYQAQRMKIFDGLSVRQMKMYNKRHGINSKEGKIDGV